MPEWLQTLQKQELQRFEERGVPTRKEERWKYTPSLSLPQTSSLSVPFAPLSFPRRRESISMLLGNSDMDSRLRGNDRELGLAGNNKNEIILCDIQTALEKHEALIKPYFSKEFDVQRFPFAVLNTAQALEGVFLYVPANTVVAMPIHLIFREQTIIRNIIVLGANSQCVFLEEHASEAQYKNIVTQIHLEDNAELHYYKLQTESVQTTHLANIFVTQKQDSRFHSFGFDLGGSLVREDIDIEQQQRGAVADLNGLYQLSENNQHVDNHLCINHLAEHCESSIVYKGILDKKTRAVFNGRVFVKKDAQKIAAYQSNHNLLLTTDAEVNTKPELEIYANDVRCTHGATVGQLDTEALFYLRSRGIEETEARKILVQAFAESVVNKISHADIKEYIAKRMGYVG